MIVHFEKIRWKNLLSTGNNWIEIILDEHATTLILGENGTGKSTFLDALSFGLFGKPFRDINKPQLTNSLNESDCVVETYFSVGENKYLVRRGIKPNIFEIFVNGKMLDQDSQIRDYQEYLEKNILHWSHKVFCQVIVLGSAGYTPFMQLKAADRRFVIEDLLDIQIFTAMNKVLRQKQDTLRTDLGQTENAIDLAKEKIDLRKRYVHELKVNVQSAIECNQFKINDNLKVRNEYLAESARLQSQIDAMLGDTEQEHQVVDKIRKLEDLERELSTTKAKLNKDISFFEKNQTCPYCKQDIDEDFKNSTVTDKVSKSLIIQSALEQLDKDLKGQNSKLDAILTVLGNIETKRKLISKTNFSIQAIEQYIEKIQKDILELQTKKDTTLEHKEQLAELQNELSLYVVKREQIIQDKHYYDIIGLMLKDNGIKTKIVRQYLPVINKLVNKYLTSLDFFVNFTLNEYFNESIKSRGRDEFSYGSFSEGEKLRIDLSLLFTWREIAKMKNSANTNLLILDEIFDSSLDAAGTEDFLKLIGTLNKGINIFIISHRADTLADKFNQVLRFKKVKNFSVLENQA